MRVYVHLAHGYDARDWERRWRSGELIGFNEPSPYGYHHAASASTVLRFSRDAAEGRVGRLVRGGLRLALGFDLVHAWRNRAALREADVVWTHTESQHLAIACLLKAMPRPRRPRLLAQSVWLMDRWDGFGALRRALYRWLIAEAYVLTFHASLNRDKARALFPGKRCELLPFGICATYKQPPKARRCDADLRVLAIGNDRHRDWATLLAAFGGQPGITLTVASGTVAPKAVARYGNVTIARPKRNAELLALYAAADVVALPLAANLHASGATVLQEAVLAGRPVVCTRAGGLDGYFAEGEVTFVPVGDAAALWSAALALARDPAAALAKAAAAQRRMAADGLSSRNFALAHAALSRGLLAGRGAEAVVAPLFRPVGVGVDANC